MSNIKPHHACRLYHFVQVKRMAQQHFRVETAILLFCASEGLANGVGKAVEPNYMHASMYGNTAKEWRLQHIAFLPRKYFTHRSRVLHYTRRALCALAKMKILRLSYAGKLCLDGGTQAAGGGSMLQPNTAHGPTFIPDATGALYLFHDSSAPSSGAALMLSK